MRDIRFRGKKLDNGEWVYGDYCDCRKLDNTVQIRCWVAKPENYYASYDVDPSTVGQYTGLKGKNGKEIYEGDIINGFDHEPTPYLIKYGDDAGFYGETAPYNGILGAGTQTVSLLNAPDWVNILGNIHSNPELLKEE